MQMCVWVVVGWKDTWLGGWKDAHFGSCHEWICFHCIVCKNGTNHKHLIHCRCHLKLCVFKLASSYYYCLYWELKTGHKKDGIYHLWFTGNALLNCFYPNVWKKDVHKKTSSITFDSLWVRNCDRALVAGAYYPVNGHIWQNLNLFSGKPLQIHIKYDQCTEWKMLM